MMNLGLTRILLPVLSIFCLSAFAQGNDQAAGGSAATAPGANAPFEFGLHGGWLLPNQIAGVTEIMGLGGVRMGFRTSPGTYLEGGLITGNGDDQQWKNFHADIRMDIPVENLVGHAYVGADSVYFKGKNKSSRLIFGGHVGGGFMAHMGGSTWFRSDMKFSFSPGASMYLGFGLVWRLGGGGSGAN